MTITESTRRFEDDSYSRHKIFLYKEDFNRFVESLNDVVDHVKTELLPDYDYEEYSRRYEDDGEWEFDQNDNSDGEGW
ncbi:PUR-alpha/beta/gamma DNA/RNA-binding protein [Saprospira grandis str. Lewin]|uniref:PUR-alpha/beta/gamma DNA/RNA-binding protein n=1 Tax=Saprospira grandis (strain Lewin) TaxID=984262 RepID=H6L4W6_SAPGL|nr:PUR-alpha/beta/gamma DNA/RNA-binding protein [Saprospira grandis str. Lewin]